MIYYDDLNKKFVGEIVDEITFTEDGTFEVSPGVFVEAKKGDKYTYPEAHNLVVDKFSQLIAVLIKGDAVYASDVNYKLYWECGSGNSSWNDAAPPAPAAADVALLAPLYRKIINLTTDISYIDASNNVLGAGIISNRLQIVVTFFSAEANGSLREFMIFGGNATATLGSGLPINRKTHGLIFKTVGMELKRTMRFTF